MNILERISIIWVQWIQAASWQLAILAIIIAILALLTRKLSPRWRYTLWLLVILKVFLPPSLTLVWGVGNWGIPPLRNHSQRIFQKYIPVQTTIIPSTQEAAPRENSTAPQEKSIIRKENPSINPLNTAPRSSADNSERSFPNILFLVWLGGFTLFISLIFIRYIYFSRILRKGCIIDEGPLRVDLERLALTLGKIGPPDLLVSDRVTSPFLFGIFHPRIILPANLPESLNPEEMKHVLLHELIHWKRRDVIVGWLQVAAQAIFWFHPFVWLANERLRHERECACDETAVSVGQSPPKSYGEAILKVLLAARGRSSASLGFLGIFERNTKLQSRLEEIMNYKCGSRRFGAASLILVILFAAIFLPMGTMQKPAAAQNTGGKSGDPTPKQKIITSEEHPAPPACLSYVDDTAEGKKSLGASGHAIRFNRSADKKFVDSVQIFAGRYGYPEPPQEDFHLYILNQEKQVLADLKYPYGMVERGELKWYTLKTPSIEVPEEFYVALSFNPHQTKGIYLGKDESVSESHSFTGLPESGFEEISEKYDWMIRVYLTQTPDEEKKVQYLKDWKPSMIENPFTTLIEVKYDTGESEGHQSYGGLGPAVKIFPQDSSITGGNIMIQGFRVYASRYGSGYVPEDTYVILTITNSAAQVLFRGKVPYAKFSYKPQWIDIDLVTPVIVGSDEPFILVALDPEAHQTKGIYFHYNKNPQKSHSFVGKIGSRFEEIPDREWMIRAYMNSTIAASSVPVEDSSPGSQAPRIIETFPPVGKTDVDPSITAITVTFDRDMNTGGYSWTGGGPNFPPKPEGASANWRDKRTCALPVRLEQGRFYRVGINSTSYRNFRSAEGVPSPPSVIYFTTSGAEEGKQKLQKPLIVDMYPENGKTDVNPNIREIIVTFNVPMDSGFSWTGGGPEFPTIMEGMSASWTNDNKTCVLPVELKPNWKYRLGLNSPSHINFQSADGVPLDPVEYSFTTGEAH